MNPQIPQIQPPQQPPPQPQIHQITDVNPNQQQQLKSNEQIKNWALQISYPDSNTNKRNKKNYNKI